MNTTSNLTFGEAIELAKDGHLISRKGWNGKGMFVFMRPEDTLSVETIVHKVKSLPQSVKSYFASQTALDAENRIEKTEEIRFTSYLCMKAADGTIVNGWLASQTDILAEDWQMIIL